MEEEKSGGIGTGLGIPQSGSVSFLGCRRSASEELYCRAELRAQSAPRRKLPLINHLQPCSAPVNPTTSGCAQYFNSGRIDSFFLSSWSTRRRTCFSQLLLPLPVCGQRASLSACIRKPDLEGKQLYVPQQLALF